MQALSITRAFALPEPFPEFVLGFGGVAFLGGCLGTGFCTTGCSYLLRPCPDASNAPPTPAIMPSLGANRTALRPADCFIGGVFCVGGVDTDGWELTVFVTFAAPEDALEPVLFPLVLLVTMVFDACLFEDGLLVLGVFADGLLLVGVLATALFPRVVSDLGTDGAAGLLLYGTGDAAGLLLYGTGRAAALLV